MIGLFCHELSGATTVHTQSNQGNDVQRPVEAAIPTRVHLHAGVLATSSFDRSCSAIAGEVVRSWKSLWISYSASSVPATIAPTPDNSNNAGITVRTMLRS